MRVVACVKHVPDTTEIRFDDAGELRLRGVPTKINDYDRNALEAAVRLREAHGAEATIVSVGPADAAKTLKEAVAFGADGALLVSGPWADSLDPAATARLLAGAVRSGGGFDLVLCGDVSEDGYHSLVPGLLAAELEVPFARGVTALELGDGEVVATREAGDSQERLRVPLPAVLSVTRLLNEPRLVTTLQVLRVPMTKVRSVAAADVGVAEEELDPARLATRVVGIRPASKARRREVLAGEADEVVPRLLARLEELEVLA